jgi:feruloyl esterase
MQKEDNFTISTWKGDISAFKNRNGKLLTYHGQADQLISPINSERYHERVRRIMNLSLEEQDTFYRFFRISGMNHCAGGPGPWEVGQTLDGAADNVMMGSPSLDPERNVLMAMVRWVEEGVPPDTFLGTKFVNDDPSEGVQFSRRHCKFPLKTTFDGIGDPTKPESWSCQ